MKFVIVFLLLLISIKASCQLDNLGKFYSEKLNDKNEDKSFIIYKIKGKTYTTDHKTFFSLEKNNIFKNNTDDDINLMLYKKRFLFIGYFPDTVEGMSGFTNAIRFCEKIEVIDLENPKKKWVYQFDKKTTMKNIKSFNPKDGDIVYCNHIKPEKNSTE